MARRIFRPRLRQLTIKNLVSEGIAPVAAKAIYLLWRSKHNVDGALSLANTALGGFGVEAIRSERQWDNYYGDSVALYVNTGDAYTMSVLYDIKADQMYATDYGTWMELRGDRYGVR